MSALPTAPVVRRDTAPRKESGSGTDQAPRPTPRVFALPAPRRRLGAILHLVTCLALLAASLVAVLMLNTAQTEGSFETHNLDKEMKALADRRATIIEELSSLGAPASLAKKARDLGMVLGKDMSYLRLEDRTIIAAIQETPAEQQLEEQPEEQADVEQDAALGENAEATPLEATGSEEQPPADEQPQPDEVPQ